MTSSTVRLGRRSRWILGGLLPLAPARLPTDIVAGATLAALAIPEVMGYTKIAGTPVITGLYTLLVPILVFAIFGSSRHLVVGADSATAAILATGLLATGAVAQSPEYVQLASVAALMCAVLLIAARLLRLGFIANFLSRSVLIGFLTGVGIQVAMGEVGGILAITGKSGGTLAKFAATLQAIPTSTSIPTLAVSVAVLATILGLGRVNRAIPGALVAVVGSIAASYILDLGSHGVTVLGTVPGGLPTLDLPTGLITRENLAMLLPTVISMVVVILAQSAATSRAYAMKYGDSFDENVDLVGLGLANAAAAITGTFVVNGSPTKTEMVDSAGGRSQVSQLTAGVIVAIVLLFLTGPLASMPEAVLSSVVFLIGLRLIDIRGMAAVARLRPGEFVVALVTALTVVGVGVEEGIVLAMALSIVEHLYHSYRPYDTLVLVAPDGTRGLAPITERAETAPGLAIYRFGSGLYYANGSRFSEEIMDIADGADPPLRWLGVSGASIGDIDYSGADTIRQVRAELARLGVTFAMCDLNPKVRAQVDAYGLTELIGAGRIYDTVDALLRAYRAATDAGPGPGVSAPPPGPAAEG